MKQKAYCCGALSHHINDEKGAKAAMRSAISSWAEELHKDGLDAIIVNTSGCGTTIKDYVNLLKDDPAYADLAKEISALAKDVTEFLYDANLLTPLSKKQVTIGYHAACSLQHGQKITSAPKALLQNAGFDVVTAKNLIFVVGRQVSIMCCNQRWRNNCKSE